MTHLSPPTEKKREETTYESVAARFARLAVGNDDGLFDFAVDLKVFAQTGVRRVVRQSADKDFGERRVFDGGGRWRRRAGRRRQADQWWRRRRTARRRSRSGHCGSAATSAPANLERMAATAAAAVAATTQVVVVVVMLVQVMMRHQHSSPNSTLCWILSIVFVWFWSFFVVGKKKLFESETKHDDWRKTMDRRDLSQLNSWIHEMGERKLLFCCCCPSEEDKQKMSRRSWMESRFVCVYNPIRFLFFFFLWRRVCVCARITLEMDDREPTESLTFVAGVPVVSATALSLSLPSHSPSALFSPFCSRNDSGAAHAIRRPATDTSTHHKTRNHLVNVSKTSSPAANFYNSIHTLR